MPTLSPTRKNEQLRRLANCDSNSNWARGRVIDRRLADSHHARRPRQSGFYHSTNPDNVWPRQRRVYLPEPHGLLLSENMRCKLEARGLVWAVNRLRQYLRTRPFTVRTDARNLLTGEGRWDKKEITGEVRKEIERRGGKRRGKVEKERGGAGV